MLICACVFIGVVAAVMGRERAIGAPATDFLCIIVVVAVGGQKLRLLMKIVG